MQADRAQEAARRRPHRIAVIIPSLAGAPDELLTALARQTRPADQVEVVSNMRPNGLARNVGVARTDADTLVFIDDDALPGDTRLVEQLTEALWQDDTLGVVGAAKLIPPSSSRFQRWVAREVPRSEHAVVDQPLETNPDPPTYYCEITTTCCAMRRAVFDQVGGFSATLVRGVDTEFFVRVRRAGYRLLLAPHCWTWHPAPASLKELVRKQYLYGVGHAQEVVADAQRAVGLQRRPTLYLVARTAYLLPNVVLAYSYAAPRPKVGFFPLRALASYVSALGYVTERWRQRSADRRS